MQELAIRAYLIGVPVFLFITMLGTCCRAVFKFKHNAFGERPFPMWIFLSIVVSMLWPGVLVFLYILTLEYARGVIKGAEL